MFLTWTLNLEGHSDAVLMALSTTGLEREGEREERQIWHTWASRSKSRESTSAGCQVYKETADYTMQTSICARHANCTGTKKPTRACKECIAIQAQPPCCCRVEMSLRPQQRFEAGRVWHRCRPSQLTAVPPFCHPSLRQRPPPFDWNGSSCANPT